MKLKTLFFTLTIIGIACVFLAGSIQAGTQVADVIPMDNPAYEKHTKGIVQFSHKKHAADYGGTCGDCHHDDKGQPLELKEGDDVQACITCHKIPGQVPKDVKKEWKAKKLKKAETNKLKLDYHAEALHANCIACHKKWNKENKSKAAPTSCTKCHPKTK
jgi:Class III cytochrome C family